VFLGILKPDLRTLFSFGLHRRIRRIISNWICSSKNGENEDDILDKICLFFNGIDSRWTDVCDEDERSSGPLCAVLLCSRVLRDWVKYILIQINILLQSVHI
jgi:hypothetical protein